MSECCAGLENWFPLQKANKDLEIQGEILLEYGIRTSEATGQSHLFVTVVEGRSVIVERCLCVFVGGGRREVGTMEGTVDKGRSVTEENCICV